MITSYECFPSRTRDRTFQPLPPVSSHDFKHQSIIDEGAEFPDHQKYLPP
jgi:hypothetical protein